MKRFRETVLSNKEPGKEDLWIKKVVQDKGWEGNIGVFTFLEGRWVDIVSSAIQSNTTEMYQKLGELPNPYNTYIDYIDKRATKTSQGIVQIGDGVNVVDGVISNAHTVDNLTIFKNNDTLSALIAKADGNDSIIGNSFANTVEGAYSAAFGYGLKSTNDYSVVVGKYNAFQAPNEVFAVGAGESNIDRKNLLIIIDGYGNDAPTLWTRGNASVGLIGRGSIPNINPTKNNHLTTKYYVDNKYYEGAGVLFTIDDNGRYQISIDNSIYYTKTDINGMLASAMHYKGVCSEANLPTTGQQEGDVWNINAVSTPTTIVGLQVGDNVAWDGYTWDVLCGVVDLSPYAKTVDFSNVAFTGAYGDLSGKPSIGNGLVEVWDQNHEDSTIVVEYDGETIQLDPSRGLHVPDATAGEKGVVSLTDIDTRVEQSSGIIPEVGGIIMFRVDTSLYGLGDGLSIKDFTSSVAFIGTNRGAVSPPTGYAAVTDASLILMEKFLNWGAYLGNNGSNPCSCVMFIQRTSDEE